MSLVWCDLETSGLRSDKESILEVAVIITDDALVEIARMQRVVYYPHAAIIVEILDRYHTIHGADLSEANYKAATQEIRAAAADIRPVVLKMHDVNGLWKDCINGLAIDTVDRDLSAFVRQHAVRTEEYLDEKDKQTKTRQVPPQLAGSTISFDRAFINAHLPRLADEKVLHYRNLDTSTFNEVAKRFWKPVFNSRPNAGRAREAAAHRGLADIIESIEVLKHYLANVGPRPAATEAP